MSKWSLVSLLTLVAAEGAGGAEREVAASQGPVQDVSQIDTVLGSQLDLVAIANEDEARDRQGLAPRFAVAEAVSITPATRGTWDRLSDGTMRWRLRILGREGVTSLNLGFTRFRMPAHGHLLLYSADGKESLRPFTAEDNAFHGQLWTPVLLTDDMIVELTVPESEVDEAVLELGSLNQGYRGFGTTPLLKSGSCNMDVECLDAGDSWRDQVRAVAVYQ